MKIKILTVEDDIYVRQTMVDWLMDSGFDVCEAEDGKQALITFKEQQPDLVLLDLGIPKMSGLEVLQSLNLDFPNTPIVVVSAKNSIHDAIDAFKAGAWDYITKPIISFGILENVIANNLERKKLREQIKLSQEKYFNLVQHIPMIIFSLDEDLQLDFINDSCLTILGYDSQYAMSSHDWFLKNIHPEDLDRAKSMLSVCSIHDSNPLTTEIRFKHKNGYYVSLEVRFISCDCLQDQDRKRVEGVLIDMTEHNMLDKLLLQREKLNTLGAMSAELAHEIRNPLVSLGGFANRMYKKYPDSLEAKIVLEEATRLEQLLNRIQSYLEPVPVELTPCDVNSLLHFCIDLLQRTHKVKDREIELNLVENINYIDSDQNILKHVFTNIIGLCLDAINKNGWSKVTSIIKGNFLEIEFKINPFPKHLQNPEIIFLPFEQDELSFGLAVSYRDLKSIGGYLSFEEQDENAAFCIRLPINYSNKE